MATYETFKLSELRLDEENFRTGATDGQREALQAVIAEQKEKLVNLAKSILDEGGLSPFELLAVFRDPKTKQYISAEGNRRLTVLKILDNPSLADGTVIEKPFRALATQFKEKPIREVYACVFASREEAEPWVRIRHHSATSGVGLQPWKLLAKGRANRKHGEKAPRSLAVFELLQDDSPEWETLSDALEPKWSTVDRVLNSPLVAGKLGVSIAKKGGQITFGNGDDAAGRKLLMQILGAMTTSEITSRTLNLDTDIENFLNRFTQLSVAVADSNAGIPRDGNPTQDDPKPAPPIIPSPPKTPPSDGGRGPKLDTTSRKGLAPHKGTRTFQVNGIRLNRIYAECRKIVVEANENAAALLLRVFLELSTEALLTEKSVAIPSKFKKSRWDEIGIPLAAKIQCAIDHLDPTTKAKEFQAARVALDMQSNSVASINTLHGYFHNRDISPQSADVMTAWDVWEPYLKALHAAR